ncbi:MAG: hypothetical protein AABX55_02465 [Nanoarchaeota archaeon]
MKSQVEFNWIFVLVAGAILLTFFVWFAVKYKDIQEEKLNIEILTNLDNSLTNLQASSFTLIDEIKLPVELQITCNDLIVNDKNYKNNNFIFSPSKLKNKMLIWYEPFKMPFKIADFYYIISSDKKFFLIYNNQDQEDYIDILIEDLPEKFKSNVIKSNTIGNGKNIYFYNANVDATKILVNQNKINIITNNNYEDVNNDLVYAAIFSDNFDCVYTKLNQETNNIIKIYSDKAILLQSPNCNYIALRNELNNFKLTNSKARTIETLNKALSLQNCPALY